MKARAFFLNHLSMTVFLVVVSIPLVVQAVPEFSEGILLAEGFGTKDIICADLDGDNDLDIVLIVCCQTKPESQPKI